MQSAIVCILLVGLCRTVSSEFLAIEVDQSGSVVLADAISISIEEGKYSFPKNISQSCNVTDARQTASLAAHASQIAGCTSKNGPSCLLITKDNAGIKLPTLSVSNNSVQLSNHPYTSALTFSSNGMALFFASDPREDCHSRPAIVRYNLSDLSDVSVRQTPFDFTDRWAFRRGFAAGDFVYFAADHQSNAVKNRRPVLMRFCDRAEAYVEAELSCGNSTVSYDVLTAFAVANGSDELISSLRSFSVFRQGTGSQLLFGLFSRSTTNASALCVYPLDYADEKFDQKRNNCQAGRGDAGLKRNGSILVQCKAGNGSSDPCFDPSSGLGLLASSLHVNPVYKSDTLLSSLSVGLIDSKTQVFVSSSAGHIMQIYVDSAKEDSSALHGTLPGDSSVVAMELDSDRNRLHVLKTSKVLYFDTSPCKTFSNCSVCLSSMSVSCGWCQASQRCSVEAECSNVWIKSKSSQCPSIVLAATKLYLPIGTNQSVNIKTSHFSSAASLLACNVTFPGFSKILSASFLSGTVTCHLFDYNFGEAQKTKEGIINVLWQNSSISGTREVELYSCSLLGQPSCGECIGLESKYQCEFNALASQCTFGNSSYDLSSAGECQLYDSGCNVSDGLCGNCRTGYYAHVPTDVSPPTSGTPTSTPTSTPTFVQTTMSLLTTSTSSPQPGPVNQSALPATSLPTFSSTINSTSTSTFFLPSSSPTVSSTTKATYPVTSAPLPSASAFANVTCRPCSENCSKCDNATTCTECRAGYKIINGHCVREVVTTPSPTPTLPPNLRTNLPTNSTTTAADTPSPGGGIKLYIIIGASGGGGALLVIIVILLACCCARAASGRRGKLVVTSTDLTFMRTGSLSSPVDSLSSPMEMNPLTKLPDPNAPPIPDRPEQTKFMFPPSSRSPSCDSLVETADRKFTGDTFLMPPLKQPSQSKLLTCPNGAPESNDAPAVPARPNPEELYLYVETESPRIKPKPVSPAAAEIYEDMQPVSEDPYYIDTDMCTRGDAGTHEEDAYYIDTSDVRKEGSRTAHEPVSRQTSDPYVTFTDKNLSSGPSKGKMEPVVEDGLYICPDGRNDDEIEIYECPDNDSTALPSGPKLNRVPTPKRTSSSSLNRQAAEKKVPGWKADVEALKRQLVDGETAEQEDVYQNIPGRSLTETDLSRRSGSQEREDLQNLREKRARLSTMPALSTGYSCDELYQNVDDAKRSKSIPEATEMTEEETYGNQEMFKGPEEIYGNQEVVDQPIYGNA
eukprot:m.310015 g.310015  ORF g.310015 m.310015 type:complete len:1245 (+) comp49112_c0_seq1:188-3922(+)